MRKIIIASVCSLALSSIVARAKENQKVEDGYRLVKDSSECYSIESIDGMMNDGSEVIAFSKSENFIVNLCSNLLARIENPDRTVRIFFHAETFLKDAVLQQELQIVLREKFPDEFARAENSSGNIHNPALKFMYGEVCPALKETTSLRRLSKLAEVAGFSPEIVVYGGEKIQIRRTDSTGKPFHKPAVRVYSIYGLGFDPANTSVGRKIGVNVTFENASFRLNGTSGDKENRLGSVRHPKEKGGNR